MNRIIKPCPFCGSKAVTWIEDGYVFVACNGKCGIKKTAEIKTDIWYRITPKGVEAALDKVIDDWNKRDINTEKKEIVNEVVSIITEHGQADKRFKIGETIKYSPSEVEKILCEEWGVKFE